MRYTRFAVLVLAGALLLGCQAAATGQQQTRSIRVAYTSEADLGDIPSLMAIELLEEQGYNITVTNYSNPPLAVEALARGDADLSFGTIQVIWAAVGRGAKIITIGEQLRNTWVLATLPDIEQCEDIAGKRLALSSEGSGSAALTRTYIAVNCPGTEYEVVLIAGSQNRAAALLSGAVDVTPLELVDLLYLQQQAPDQVRALVWFADDLPDMVVTGIHVNKDFAESSPETVEDFLRALLAIHRQIAEDPDTLVQKAAEVLEMDVAELGPIIEAHLAFDAWPASGSLTEDEVRNSLAFYQQLGELPETLAPSDVADLHYLENVLGN